MKKIILNVLFLFVVVIGQAQTQATPIKSQKGNVSKVIMFQTGAQLFYSENVSIGAGTTQIAFENVSPYLLQHTLQAAAQSSSVVVLDVRYNVKVVENTEETDKTLPDEAVQRYARDIKAAQDSIVELDFLQKDISYKINALQAERTLLANNRMMRGEIAKDSMALFVQVINFYKERLNKMDAESLQLEREQAKINKQRSHLTDRIRNFQLLMAGKEPKPRDTPKPTPQVIVTFLSDYATTTTVEFNYAVQQAGWTAGYDLRASKETPNIDLKHRAQVWQNTGVNWQNVALILSTGDPNQSNVKPVLQPQFLTQAPPPQYYQNVQVTGMATKKPAAAPQNNSNARYKEDLEMTDDAKVQERKAADYNLGNVSQNMTRIEYEIKVKYSIESDGKPRNVVIQTRNVPATYVYSVIPKLDGDAFLIAKVTGWEDMNLVAGAARIYFDNSFIGETTINPSNLSDTLSLNLGRDKGIVVTRTKLKDKSKDKFIGDDRVLTREYEIALRSTKSNNIRIVVEDQMPVSNDAAIKITPLDNDDAKYNAETGKLIWDINLKGRDTRRLRFSYEVRYNKDKNVYGL
jgi:uncharacterized protein (TIGR02231 family)